MHFNENMHDQCLDLLRIHLTDAKWCFKFCQEMKKIVSVVMRSDRYNSQTLFVDRTPQLGETRRALLNLNTVRSAQNLESIANNLQLQGPVEVKKLRRNTSLKRAKKETRTYHDENVEKQEV